METIENLVDELVKNIQGNKDIIFKSLFDHVSYGTGSTVEFNTKDPLDTVTYQNMGATIIDAVLQAGMNYERAVRPRVTNFRNKHPDIKKTSDFLKFIRSGALEETIDWKGDKINRIIHLTEFLISEGIETEKDFAIWLKNELNILKLKNIKGIKEKTVDYIKLLCGIKDTVAIDLHLINFIKENTSLKIDLSYDLAKQILISVADKIKIEPAKLDHGIWRYMSQRSRS